MLAICDNRERLLLFMPFFLSNFLHRPWTEFIEILPQECSFTVVILGAIMIYFLNVR